MGYYFQFEINATLRRDTPRSVIDTIFHEIFSCFLENYPDTFTKMVADSLKDIYIAKVINAKPDYSDKFWQIKRAKDMFSWYSGKYHPYIQPDFSEHFKFKDDPDNYLPHWNIRLVGDLNFGYEAINGFVEYITPYVAGHKPKQHIGWYKGEDQNNRINLYAVKNLKIIAKDKALEEAIIQHDKDVEAEYREQDRMERAEYKNQRDDEPRDY